MADSDVKHDSASKAELIKVNNIYIPDEGYYFGNGVFETIRVLNGAPLFLMRHIMRMANSATELGFINDCERLAFSEELKIKLESYLEKLIESSEIPKDAVFKAAFSCGNLYLSFRENTYKTSDYDKGFSLDYSKVLRNETSPFTYHKTLNYGDNIREKRLAHKNGFDEPVFLNTKGELTEGATTNIFLVKENIIYTPSVSSGLLAGTIRGEIIDYFSDKNKKVRNKRKDKLADLKVKETILYTEDIEKSSQMFVTNSLLGVMPVNRCGKREFDIKTDFINLMMQIFNY